MASGPECPKTPLELLENDGSRPPGVFAQVWAPIIGGSMGFISVGLMRVFFKRPLMSGIPNYIFWTGLGAGLATWRQQRKDAYMAERDAVLRHYIQLHPDDFPPYDRKKYSEVLHRWIPIRN